MLLSLEMNNQKRKIQLLQDQIYNESPQQPWCFQSQVPNTKMINQGNFESPTSVFYATENCMGFSSQEDYTNTTSRSFNIHHQDSKDDFDLQSVVKFHLQNNHQNSTDKFPHQRRSGVLPTYVNFSEYQYHHHHHKEALNYCYRMSNSSHSAAVAPTITSKPRIRWTQDLHNRFVECVEFLGGAEKATPKGILKLMDIDGLTICHVKSHLQKYRFARYIPESNEGGKSKSERATDHHMGAIARLDPKAGNELVETLKLQLDVQKRLHEQLEVQRNLQLQIEEQGKRLKQMIDHQLIQDKKVEIVDITHNITSS